MWVVMTDRHVSRGASIDLSGATPSQQIIDWGVKGGLRTFLSYESHPDIGGNFLVHTFDDATRFETKEEAEAEAFSYCTAAPVLIGHIGVYEEEEAGRINTRETLEWMVTMDEMKQKMKAQ